jgi:hypothetical protein
MDAIESLANNRPLAPAQLASASATLEAAAQPTAAAVEFPILPTLRLLVAAASEPGRRAELSRDAWRRQLEEIEAQFVKRASKS